jgi:hypothetical protein
MRRPNEVMLVCENRAAAELAQAMGRRRLRTMTKEDGTCEPCDMFLRLPDERRLVDPDRVIDAVKRTLPAAAVPLGKRPAQSRSCVRRSHPRSGTK